MTDNLNSRDLILEILLSVTRDGEYSHLAIRSVLEKYQYLDKRERSFITIVSEGTLENLIEIDYIIDQFSNTKTGKMKPVIKNILRMGVYQIKYMDTVPASAACNEAVKLAGKRGFKDLKGFVNGVLRNILRRLDEVTYPDEKKDYIKAVSVKYSIPEWMLERWEKDFGRKKTKSLAEASHTEARTVIRVNTDRITPEELKKKLEDRGIKVTPVPVQKLVEQADLDYAFYIVVYDDIAAIPEFEEGLFVVQDISSMLVGAIASPKKGDYCIDVCAAPGGKALHLSTLLGGSGHVDARDKTEYKVSLIEETIERQKASNISAKVWDATVTDEEALGKADIVIADLPCSGLGIIRRKTDIKYHLEEKNIDELASLQERMLDTVEAYVKPGGTLIFSTCTMSNAENHGNVEKFLQKHADFEKVMEKQIFFDNGISDGFFISKFIRSR